MKKETMLGRIFLALNSVPAEMLGTVLDLLNRLIGKKGQETFKNLKHLLRGEGEFEVKLPSLIQWLGTTTISATTEKFVAREKFCVDSKEVKFKGFYGSFQEDFLAGNGKIEELLGEQEICYGNITKDTVDRPIIDELGGDAKAETTLTELWGLLKKHAQGEESGLLTNGCANIFYVRNTSGVLRAVDVYWYVGGWRVSARSVESPHDWSAGYRVFYRNS